MAQVPLNYGELVLRDWKWHFEVDYPKGGRMFYLSYACTHCELIEMARDDCKLTENADLIELTYMVLDAMLQVLDKDCPSPPIHVINDRHVWVFLELSKSHCVRLCVSSFVGKVSENNEEVVNADNDDEKDDDAKSDENFEDDYDEFEEDDVVFSYGDEGVGEAHEDNAMEEAVVKDKYLDHNSVYAKINDEDSGDSDDDDKPFLGAEGSFIGEGRRSSMTWTDDISLYKSFLSKDLLISKLHVTTIMGQFAFKVKKSTKSLFLARCHVGGCKWRVRAMVKNKPKAFSVTVYEKYHTFQASDRVALRKRYAPRYIGKLFYDEWRKIDGVMPEMLRCVLFGKFELKMNYTTSYRVLLFAQQMVRGTPEDGYEQLPNYLYCLALANPGTITDLVLDSEIRFKYIFFCLGASKEVFQYLRRVMVVDGYHLSGKYGGVLLVACGQDGNFQIFSLAFANVDSENDESWEWFFTKLSACVSSEFSLTVVSDRHTSIKKAIETVMPWATRGICYYHLQNNKVTKFKGKHLLYLVRGAAYTYMLADYTRYMDALREAKPELAEYLESADVILWARRYNSQTSNIAASNNFAIKRARGFPIPFLLEFIREKLARYFFKKA